MRLKARDVARLIDISAVRTQHGEPEIREIEAAGGIRALPDGAVES